MKRFKNIDEFDAGTTGALVGKVVAKTVVGVMAGVNAVIEEKKSYKNSSFVEKYKRHDIERRDALKRLEKIERKVQKQQKMSFIFAAVAFILLMSGAEFFVTAGFAIASGAMFYGLKDLKLKRDFLIQEFSSRAMDTIVPDGINTTTAEKIILKHAHAKKGKVYPEILAVESELSLSEIDKMMVSCVDKHLATIEIDKNGRTYYYFSSFDDPYDPFAELDKK
ncbi:MAG: hypothetical protein V4642_13785 [Bacteroidota bacterium]